MIRWILAPLLCCCAIGGHAMDRSEAEKWSQDLDALHQGLQAGHIDLYHRLEEAAFTAALEDIRQRLRQLTPLEAEMAVWRLLHMIGGGVSDGHTAVLVDFKRYQWLPVRFAIYGEEVRIVGATKQYHPLLGTRLVRVGKTPTAEVLDTVASVAQFTENAQSERFFLTSILRCADVLHGLGLTGNAQKVRLVVQDDAGRRKTVSLTAEPYAQSRHIVDGYPTDTPTIPQPANGFSNALWFSNIDGLSAVYVNFDRYPSLADMDTFGERLLASIQSNNTKNVIIDLRGNFGGNGFVGHRLAAAILDENIINWRNGVYVLTGAQTYSAAMMNAVEYRQILNARLVGEPTGGNPVGYQDADRFRLPHTGLVISFSKRLYRMQDVATPGVIPDVQIRERWSDRRAGKDAALGWVLDDIERRSRAN